MSERKKYLIGGKEFYLKEEYPLKDRIEVNKLVRKIPALNDRKSEGLSYEETLQLYNLITEPVEVETDKSIISEIDEETEIVLVADFFLKRLNLLSTGTEYLNSTPKN